MSNVSGSSTLACSFVFRASPNGNRPDPDWRRAFVSGFGSVVRRRGLDAAYRFASGLPVAGSAFVLPLGGEVKP
jgi:hypothetical protein